MENRLTVGLGFLQLNIPSNAGCGSCSTRLKTSEKNQLLMARCESARKTLNGLYFHRVEVSPPATTGRVMRRPENSLSFEQATNILCYQAGLWRAPLRVQARI